MISFLCLLFFYSDGRARISPVFGCGLDGRGVIPDKSKKFMFILGLEAIVSCPVDNGSSVLKDTLVEM
jgi:hypothetical protein